MPPERSQVCNVGTYVTETSGDENAHFELLDGFSVIVPVYNSERFLSEAIDSLVLKSEDVEYIFVNNCSDDNSLSILEEKARNRSDFRILSCAEKGISYALNFGIKASRFKNIVRFDSDDVCDPNRFQIQFDEFRNANDDMLVLGSDMRIIDQFGKKIGYLMFPSDPVAARTRLSWGTPVAHPTVVFSRYLYNLVGGYPAGTSPAEDYAFWLRANSVGARFRSINKPLVFYRIYGGNASTVMSKHRREVVRKERNTYLLTIEESSAINRISIGLNSASPRSYYANKILIKDMVIILSLAATIELLYIILDRYRSGSLGFFTMILLLLFLPAKLKFNILRIVFYKLSGKIREKIMHIKYSVFPADSGLA